MTIKEFVEKYKVDTNICDLEKSDGSRVYCPASIETYAGLVKYYEDSEIIDHYTNEYGNLIFII